MLSGPSLYKLSISSYSLWLGLPGHLLALESLTTTTLILISCSGRAAKSLSSKPAIRNFRNPPKTNAEHQKAFRERQKINKRESNAALNAPSKTKKTQTEHCKEYQQKSRLKRHRVQLDALLFEKSEAPQSKHQVD
ncbi:hypothetical protein evm_004351 [Chilo suppressalis]|nr:hypothetical protein evm_004351 [Chilo suppressalis]